MFIQFCVYFVRASVCSLLVLSLFFLFFFFISLAQLDCYVNLYDIRNQVANIQIDKMLFSIMVCKILEWMTEFSGANRINIKTEKTKDWSHFQRNLHKYEAMRRFYSMKQRKNHSHINIWIIEIVLKLWSKLWTSFFSEIFETSAYELKKLWKSNEAMVQYHI